MQFEKLRMIKLVICSLVTIWGIAPAYSIDDEDWERLLEAELSGSSVGCSDILLPHNFELIHALMDLSQGVWVPEQYETEITAEKFGKFVQKFRKQTRDFKKLVEQSPLGSVERDVLEQGLNFMELFDLRCPIEPPQDSNERLRRIRERYQQALGLLSELKAALSLQAKEIKLRKKVWEVLRLLDVSANLPRSLEQVEIDVLVVQENGQQLWVEVKNTTGVLRRDEAMARIERQLGSLKEIREQFHLKDRVQLGVVFMDEPSQQLRSHFQDQGADFVRGLLEASQ